MQLLLFAPDMQLVSKLKTIIFPILLLLWLFFISLAAVIYTPWTYQINCHWNPRCEQLGIVKIETSSSELASFFRHELSTLPSPPWSEKESQHLTEVRGMYEQAFWLFILITAVLVLDLVLSKRAQCYQAYAVIIRNLMLGLLVVMLLISPFFRFFWMEIFHPLVFSNELWRTDPKDISWYLMPSNYFLWIIVFLLATTLLLNQLLVWLLPKDRDL
ncbi:DUF1461 domain-containing protein [uncultured Thiothrix sp.]|uniref:lipoprotein intramolecular transacylase Lit n=1 Tax=uncultured Thiothrix sp. TaxID=223185 RepID=UPI00261EC8EB|nr:DUF1461 domain-containing protein [uncultured Thiothrix sp.]HMT93995.1 DUF1461 domain-containing protein [Thiolinea sp.]